MLVETHALTPNSLSSHDALQVYNGLDNCVTLEVHEALQALFTSEPEVYKFELALQAPALEIMLRGWRVDLAEREKGAQALRVKLIHLERVLAELADAVWSKPLNPRSPPQLRAFFYSAMHLPEQWTSQKGVKKLSMNRETLEKLEVYFHAQPLISTILAIREASKQLEILETSVDSDERWRTSYNIGGTTTGRWSSSASATGTGSNTQNVDPDLRQMFVADQGYILIGVDREQAESREVGWLCGTLFNDWSYLDACEHGDLHTTTAKLVWPQLAWTGEPKTDRTIAEGPFYRHFSYRDMSKRGGHGTSYLGTPFTMARHLKVPVGLMEIFQLAFFGAYPGILKWHQWVAQQIQTVGSLTTPFGRTRTFFGRPTDPTTLREAVAFGPQSATADRTNLGLWRVWKYLPEVQLLGQVHDAIYLQVPITLDIHSIVDKILKLTSVPFIAPNGRIFDVPGDVKWGFNWGAYHEHSEKCKPNCQIKINPDGLRKYSASSPLPLRQRALA